MTTAPTLIERAMSRLGFERKASKTQVAGYAPQSRTQVAPYGYQQFASRGYMRNSDVYACVSQITTAAKAVEWYTPEGKSAAIEQLLKNPHRGLSFPTLLEQWLCYLLLSGNSYLEAVPNGQGKPVELYTQRPDRMRARMASDGRTVLGWYYVWNGKQIDFTLEEMRQSKLFNPLDDVFGMSPLDAAMYHIDLANDAAIWLRSLMRRGTVPGVIETTVEISEPDYIDLKKQLRESRENGEELILENATYKKSGLDPTDSGIIDLRILNKRDIASVLHVPGELIGDATAKTYANYREARRALITEGVLPLLIYFRDEINDWLGDRMSNSVIEIDRDSIEVLSDQREEVAGRAVKLFSTGVATQNEARLEAGFDEVRGGDVFYAPANLVELGSTSEAALPRAASAPDSGERKAFQLDTKEAKEQWWREFDMQIDAWSAAWTRKASALFVAEGAAVASAYERTGNESSAVDAIDERDWSKYISSLYLTVVHDAGNYVASNLKADDIFTRAALGWIRKYGAEKVTDITGTTRAAIQKIVRDGMRDSKSRSEIARDLRDKYDEFSKSRSKTIARTEVHQASHFGSYTAAKSTGVPMTKEWISTPDNRVRDDHEHADGQIKAIDEPFIVGGEKLMYPGDSRSASPGNTINCRCTVGYRVRR